MARVSQAMLARFVAIQELGRMKTGTVIANIRIFSGLLVAGLFQRLKTLNLLPPWQSHSPSLIDAPYSMKTIKCLLLLSFFGAATAFGQTITWTAATNPHIVNGTYTVPAGQTLVMEPGVIVQIQPNSTLLVYRSEERRVGKECRSRWVPSE